LREEKGLGKLFRFELKNIREGKEGDTSKEVHRLFDLIQYVSKGVRERPFAKEGEGRKKD
jgi:hypothetical protein